MGLTRRRLLGVVAASPLPLAGCAGDGGGDTAETTTTTEQTTSTAATTATETAATETTTTDATTTTTQPTTTTTEATTTTTQLTTTTTDATTTTATTTATTTTAPEVDATVEMVGFAFDPVRLDVAVGATVEWVNESGYGHDVTSARFSEGAASWDKSTTLAGGESTTHTFDSAGAYEYYCTIHGRTNMCGVVVVGDVSYDGDLPCGGGG